MRPVLVAIGVLLVVLSAGCSDDDERTLQQVEPSRTATDEPTPSSPPVTLPTPTPTPSTPSTPPTCGVLSLGKVSKAGSGFIVELNIMSGMPNPAWRLGKADGLELQRLLQTTRRGIDRDGPDDLGGYGVTADRGAAVGVLQGLGLSERFWVQGHNELTDFLEGTLPCEPRAS